MVGRSGSEGGGLPRGAAMLVRGFVKGVTVRGFENGLVVDWCGFRAFWRPCINCDIPAALEEGGRGWRGFVGSSGGCEGTLAEESESGGGRVWERTGKAERGAVLPREGGRWDGGRDGG